MSLKFFFWNVSIIDDIYDVSYKPSHSFFFAYFKILPLCLLQALACVCLRLATEKVGKECYNLDCCLGSIHFQNLCAFPKVCGFWMVCQVHVQSFTL